MSKFKSLRNFSRIVSFSTGRPNSRCIERTVFLSFALRRLLPYHVTMVRSSMEIIKE